MLHKKSMLLDRFNDQLTPKQFLFNAIRDYYVEQA